MPASASTAVLAGAVAGSEAMNEAVDALMRDYQGEVPGASVLVVANGRPVVSRSYGYADLEARLPATPRSNYRLASLSKQFTAASILLLAQDRVLALDDRVRDWLPTLPASAGAVTLEHLLTHTSGLIDYEDVMAQDNGGNLQLRDADVLHLLESQHHGYFAPGTGYRYSNSGYALLALVVEKASRKRYAAFLHERIFVLLGMRHAVAWEAGVSTVADRAYGYRLAGSGWQRADQSPTSAVLGDGGIYCSIEDLAKWDAALDDDRLLDSESRRLAFTPWTRTDDPGVEYGFGWRITGETLWHSGESTGFRNVIVRYPRRRLTVVVLSNRDAPEPYRKALRIAALFLP